MANNLHRTIRILLTIVVLATAVFLACNRTIFVMEFIFPMFTMTLASMLIVHFSVRPIKKDAVFVVCLTLLHAVVAYQFFSLPYNPMHWPAFAGFSSFWVLCVRTIWEKKSEQKLLAFATVSALLLLTVEWGATIVLKWDETLHPKTLDLLLYSFDGSLGTQFSFLMGRVFLKWRLFGMVSVKFYEALPIALTLICARHIAARSAKALSAIAALIFTGPIGVAFYNLFPALGPRHIAQLEFPFHILTHTQILNLALADISVPGPRNAIPSLHMAWVLLVWWYSRGLAPWTRAVAFLFLVFTAAATLGTGEHYFVDLVVAFPFAVFIESLCSFDLPLLNRQRTIALSWGLGATLVWLALLRFDTAIFWISPVVPWTLVVCTILVSWICERELQSSNSLSGVPERVSVSAAKEDLLPSFKY
jgi:hypothetical protein